MPPILRYKKLMLLLILLIIVYLICFNLSSHLDKYTKKKPVHTPAIKFILSWNVPLSKIRFPNPGYEPFQTCSIKNCYLMDDPSVLPTEDYAAIIFYGLTSWEDDEYLPTARTPNQRYIYFSDQPPTSYDDDSIQYVQNSFFNWTMTYRSDSDIVNRPGLLEKEARNYSIPTLEEVQSKKSSIMYFTSSCINGTSKKEQLVDELRKYVTLDTYGPCGEHFCEDAKDCFRGIENYMFYLAFEDSYCKDYVTDGVYEALQRDVVPVVFGGADYESLTPPFSVVNVEDFVSIEELVNYLKHLEYNAEAYLNYFQWKKEYVIDMTNTKTLCELCEKLHDVDEPVKSYEDILTWWFDFQCDMDGNLPRITFASTTGGNQPIYIQVPWF